METCIYSGSLIVPINYPCIDDNVFGTTIHWGNEQHINNNTISEEFLMELAVFEVTLIISLLFMFVILFFFKKYV
jgi:hypothetical protein